MKAELADHIAATLPHGVEVLFTTRAAGNLSILVEEGEQNRARLLALIGAERLAFGRQVHGSVVVRDSDAVVEADGQVVTRPGVAAMVLAADCMPIALAGPESLAMVHAGWRGLSVGVLEAGVRACGEVTAAAIGPCARACCYEVADDVRQALGLEPLGEPSPIDLPRIARQRLAAAGVEEILDTGLCTMCSDRFFSHRRDGAGTGRQAGVAWR